SKGQILNWFEHANYQDCRINAYPAFVSKAEEQDYKRGINLDIFAPNILFIDLDAKDMSDKELQRALKQTCKNIATLLYDAKPLMIWSGHGYHIIIPVNAKEALENYEEFSSYVNEPSKAFLQFAERHLSLNKADPSNNPGFKSCLLRVPYTFNSNCIVEGIDPEVRIIQKWDNSKPLPDIDSLLIEFQTFLIDRKLNADKEKKRINGDNISNQFPTNNRIQYIERLLEMPLIDYRKNAISLILVPYFVNIQKQSDADSFDRIREWVLKCNEVKELEPSVAHFDELINKSIKRARDTGIKPLKFEETLRYKNQELYYLLRRFKIQCDVS
ncbi:MAG: DNA primase noncatalytic subunit PriX, partial [Nitrososphaeraceae archaeon]